jgi:glycosyltransferase involved in cell wall biosynthesis
MEAEALRESFAIDYVVVEWDYRSWQTFRFLLKNLAPVLIAMTRLRIPPVPSKDFFSYLLIAGITISKNQLLARKYDMIYAHWLFPAGLVALIIGKITRTRVVSAIGGYDIQRANVDESYGLRGGLHVISKYVILRCDGVVVKHRIHMMVASQLVGAKTSGKLVYIKPAISDMSRDIEPYEQAICHSFEPDERIVLCSPSLRRIDGALEVIEAMTVVLREKPRVRLLILGEGELKRQAISLSSQNKLGDRVIFLGKIDHRYMAWFYKLADIVCDACYIGSGTTTLEAFCLGRPVIGFKSPKSLIEDGYNGFVVDRGKPKRLAERMLVLLRDEALRRRMGDNAARTFISYDMESRISDLSQLFRRVAGA